MVETEMPERKAKAARVRILLAHNHGHQNVGDDAMADNVWRKLKRHDPEIKTISTYSPPCGAALDDDVHSLSRLVSNYQNLFVKLFIVLCHRLRLRALFAGYSWSVCEAALWVARHRKTKIVSRFLADTRVGRLITAIDDSDAYFRSGSGSLNDLWFWSSFYPQFTEARIARLLGKRVIFSGQGLGPLSTGYRRKALKKLLEVLDIITLRDPVESQELIRSVGPVPCRFWAAGDDAQDLENEDLPGSVNASLGSGQRLLVCQFRPTNYERTISGGYWRSIAEQLDLLADRNQTLRVVAVGFSHGRVADLEAAARIRSYSRTGFEILGAQLRPGQYRSLLGRASIAIGHSYHFGVFALSQGVPFVGLYSNDYYRAKLLGLLEWYGLQNLALDEHRLETLAEVANQAIAARATMAGRFRETNDFLKTQCNKVFNEIAVAGG